MSPRRRATLRDIAESLDLSINTVSRALADKDGPGETTRQRIKAEAERLGYVPNTMARSLVAGNARTIGLVITNPANPFYARLISAIEERCRTYGYAVMLMVTEDRLSDELRATEELMRWGVDGVLGVPVQDGAEHWVRLRRSGTPVVLLNRALTGFESSLVGVDYYAGAKEAAEHALSVGSPEIHLIEEGLEVTAVTERIRGFSDVLHEQGLDPSTRITRLAGASDAAPGTPFTPARACELALDLIPGLPRGTTLLVSNDYDAVGIYRALDIHEMSCPGDLRVVGFGDHAFSAYLNPPLTTVRLPAAEVGTAGVDRLLTLLSSDDPSEDTDPTTTLIAPELLVRESTHGSS